MRNSSSSASRFDAPWVIVTTGRATPNSSMKTGSALVLLDGYREWFNHHLDVMTDLDKRMPRGIRWLREPQATN